MERIRKITTKPDNFNLESTTISLGGYLQGEETYLWIGSKDGQHNYGVISRHRLYRLAKAITKQFENKI